MNATDRRPVVWIASYLKSGSTWTRLLRAWAAEVAGERQFCKVHDALHDTAAGEPMFPEDVTAGAICLVRNLLDMAVSWAFHCGYDPREAAC